MIGDLPATAAAVVAVAAAVVAVAAAVVAVEAAAVVAVEAAAVVVGAAAVVLLDLLLLPHAARVSAPTATTAANNLWFVLQLNWFPLVDV